jgi:hypothetical protein
MTSLFGGSKSKVKDTTPWQFQNLRGDTARLFEQLTQQGYGKDVLGGIPQSQASQTGYAAPITGAEQAALGQVAAGANDPGRQQLLADTMSGKYVDPASNPFLKGYVEAAQRQTAQTYEDVLGRVLPGQFTQAGQFTQPGGSSPFALAAAREASGFANALKDIATNIGYQAYESERGRQQQAIQLSQSEVDTSIKNLQQQALPRMIEQYGIDKGLEEFQSRTQSLLQILQMLSGGMLNQTTVTQKTSPDMITPFSQLGGSALMAGATLGAGGGTAGGAR